MRTGEAARRLGVKPITVRRWYHDGRLEGRRLAGWLEIETNSIERLLREAQKRKEKGQ